MVGCAESGPTAKYAGKTLLIHRGVVCGVRIGVALRTLGDPAGDAG